MCPSQVFVLSAVHSIIPLANVQSLASGAQLGRHVIVLAGKMRLLLVMIKGTNTYTTCIFTIIRNSNSCQNVGRTSGHILHFSTISFRSCGGGPCWIKITSFEHEHGTHVIRK